MHKGFSILVLPVLLLAGFSPSSEKISGGYECSNGYEYHFVRLKSNHQFYKDQRGCTYGSITKGTWSIQSDTLTLKRTHYKSTRNNKPFESSILQTERYLVRKDSLIELYKTDSGQIVRADILIRK